MTIYRGLGGLHLSLRRLYIIVVIDCGVWHLEDNDGKIYRKTTVPESFFNKAWGRQLYLKVTLAQVFSYEFCKISKNTFFTEHLWATASKATIKSSSWNFFFFWGGGEGGNETLLHFFRCNNVVNLFDNTVLFENVEKKILIDVMTHNRHRRN